ncbi:S49 family peptidase [Thiorhodococcus mannitoliphagus]|uniref:S49 family peptidase n=1 Tax=Thiorhodococcus mannitoliphagus TaxID=329406 RepID=A0A6P1DVK8_9GAMM|nr:S49 family peptidase [Thiorhodococcus mannitoliphagus]NEX21520.1 S49 family peptidase [Thiorhodococcus mannitoliphagus]
MKWRFWKRPEEPMPAPGQPDWERAVLNRMAGEYLHDQRSRRRWGNLFKLLILLYLIGLLALANLGSLKGMVSSDEDHTALIDIKGVIAPESAASADRVIGALRTAFESDKVQGIILRINSPGGSPVQAGYINDEIKRLKAKYQEEHDKDMPVYAVAVDLCASGGYYIAVGADAIYVDKASLVGSIGVRIDSFGFQQAMHDFGVERRLLTAGDNKGILDPFSPLPEAQRLFVQGVLDTLHQQFIAEVKAGRGDKLKGGEEIFSGLFWSGQEAVELGLADGLGSSSSVAREIIGTETLVDYTKKRDLLESVAKRLGASFGLGVSESLSLSTGLGLPH